MTFPHLNSKASDFLRHPELCKTREGLVDLICLDCEFWKEDEENYECAGFKMVKLLLEKGVVTVEGIVRAAQE
jgi:hypothetical protein